LITLTCGIGTSERPLRVLLIGAHADDIEIGCGGTVLSLLRRPQPIEVTWLVLAAGGPRKEEAISSADSFLAGATKRLVLTHTFRDGFFPYDPSIKDVFEGLKSAAMPDLIFTHYRDDRHQDHRMVSDLTWNTFRSHVILEYEVPKYDGDLASPNVFVSLSRDTCEAKNDALMTHYKSQAVKRWFTRDTFIALARLRGIEAGDSTGYAEAFYGRKLPLAFGEHPPSNLTT
jgi:LmbE family N-acetylglucosaminyl deacetylase